MAEETESSEMELYPPEEEELQEYPLPDPKKILKVTGDQLDYVLLVPKGYGPTYPPYPPSPRYPRAAGEEKEKGKEKTPKAEKSKESKPQAASEVAITGLADALSQVADLQRQIAAMQEKIGRLEQENAEKTAELEKIRQEELTNIASEIVSMRIEKGLTPEDKKDAEVEKLAKLSKEQLEILREDTKNIIAKSEKPNPQAEVEKELEDREAQKRELRMRLFGHADPLEVQEG